MPAALPVSSPNARPNLRVFDGEAEKPEDRLDYPGNRSLILAAIARCEEVRRVVEAACQQGTIE